MEEHVMSHVLCFCLCSLRFWFLAPVSTVHVSFVETAFLSCLAVSRCNAGFGGSTQNYSQSNESNKSYKTAPAAHLSNKKLKWMPLQNSLWTFVGNCNDSTGKCSQDPKNEPLNHWEHAVNIDLTDLLWSSKSLTHKVVPHSCHSWIDWNSIYKPIKLTGLGHHLIPSSLGCPEHMEVS